MNELSSAKKYLPSHGLAREKRKNIFRHLMCDGNLHDDEKEKEKKKKKRTSVITASERENRKKIEQILR